MKIKADFITNSSSHSYIIMLPKDFQIQDNLSMLEKGGIFNRFDWYTGPGGVSEIKLDKIEHFFEVLLEQGSILEGMWEDGRVYIFIVIDICRELNLIITDYDIPHEGNNSILNVGVPSILDRVKEIGGLVEDKTRLRDQ